MPLVSIRSAEEFERLRRSERPAEYRRAALEDAPIAVWQAVLPTHPDMREWAAMNEVYLTFFRSHRPARSAFGTSGLALGARLELECIAAGEPRE